LFESLLTVDAANGEEFPELNNTIFASLNELDCLTSRSHKSKSWEEPRLTLPLAEGI
jgi:hypothetical protein